MLAETREKVDHEYQPECPAGYQLHPCGCTVAGCGALERGHLTRTELRLAALEQRMDAMDR